LLSEFFAQQVQDIIRKSLRHDRDSSKEDLSDEDFASWRLLLEFEG
jgi:hypothetical protein